MSRLSARWVGEGIHRIPAPPFLKAVDFFVRNIGKSGVLKSDRCSFTNQLLNIDSCAFFTIYIDCGGEMCYNGKYLDESVIPIYERKDSP